MNWPLLLKVEHFWTETDFRESWNFGQTSFVESCKNGEIVFGIFGMMPSHLEHIKVSLNVCFRSYLPIGDNERRIYDLLLWSKKSFLGIEHRGGGSNLKLWGRLIKERSLISVTRCWSKSWPFFPKVVTAVFNFFCIFNIIQNIPSIWANFERNFINKYFQNSQIWSHWP